MTKYYKCKNACIKSFVAYRKMMLIQHVVKDKNLASICIYATIIQGHVNNSLSFAIQCCWMCGTHSQTRDEATKLQFC